MPAHVRITTRLLTAVAFAAWLTGCAGLPTSVETPQVSLASVALQSAGLMEQRYRVTLRVANPNPITLPIKDISYAVRLAGADFASGNTPNAFRVAANGESLVDIDIATNLLQTARQLMTFLAAKPAAVDYALSGKVTVDLPFIQPIPFSSAGQVAFTALGN